MQEEHNGASQFEISNPPFGTKQGNVPQEPSQVLKTKMSQFTVHSQQRFSLLSKLGINVISDTRIGHLFDHFVCIMEASQQRHERGLINGQRQLAHAR